MKKYAILAAVVVFLFTAQPGWAATATLQAYTLGDSVTYNTYVPPGQPMWPDLEAQAYPWMHFTNLAIPGAKTANIMQYEVPKIVAGPTCKLIVLSAGIDDVNVHEASEITPALTQETEYLGIVDKIRAECPNATILVSTYVNDWPDGSPLWDGHTDFRYPALVTLNNFIRAVPFLRYRYPIVLCDLAADARFFPFHIGDESPYMRNAIHQNAAGQYPYAEDEEASLTTVAFGQ